MKRMTFIAIGTMLMLLIAGCGGGSIDFSVETPPKYKDGEAYEMVVKAEDNGESVTGLNMIATLEMAKMDHGIIEVVFSDNGDGTYVGEVELPMAGEWIAALEAEEDGEVYETTLTFDVTEG